MNKLTDINSVMVRLNKPAKPVLGVFVLKTTMGKLKIVSAGINTKRFEQHFKDYQPYFVGTYNHHISKKALIDDVNFVLKGL